MDQIYCHRPYPFSACVTCRTYVFILMLFSCLVVLQASYMRPVGGNKYKTNSSDTGEIEQQSHMSGSCSSFICACTQNYGHFDGHYLMMSVHPKGKKENNTYFNGYQQCQTLASDAFALSSKVCQRLIS